MVIVIWVTGRKKKTNGTGKKLQIAIKFYHRSWTGNMRLLGYTSKRSRIIVRVVTSGPHIVFEIPTTPSPANYLCDGGQVTLIDQYVVIRKFVISFECHLSILIYRGAVQIWSEWCTHHCWIKGWSKYRGGSTEVLHLLLVLKRKLFNIKNTQ